MTDNLKQLGDSRSDLIDAITKIKDQETLETIIDLCQIAILLIPTRENFRRKQEELHNEKILNLFD